MKMKIALLPGDGIGPEVIAEATKVLDTVAGLSGFTVEYCTGLVGGVSLDKHGVPLTPEVLAMCAECEAILFGAIGDPRWDNAPDYQRPEKALLELRKAFGCFANLRPVKLYPALRAMSCLRPDLVGNGVDLLIVRELTGGLYYGQPKGRLDENGQRAAVDTMHYTEQEIARVARVAFDAARNRRRKVTSVDKANVLMTSRLWREVVCEVAKEYPDVELEHQLVDSMAMKLITHASNYDVILTENTFGDILSDEAAVLAGSLGMLPSGTISQRTPSFFEPCHGSAPDIAGRGVANPLATILTTGMMLQYAFGLTAEAALIERAVEAVLDRGMRTPDLVAACTPGTEIQVLSTTAMGDAVAATVRELAGK